VRLAAITLALAFAAGSALAAPAPKMAIRSYAELKAPIPPPYDEKANADAALGRALKRAKANGKRVLIDLGGNWCGDCLVLSATMDRPELRTFLNRHFEVVMVDVGQFDRNLQIPARYGFKDRLEGVPALLVVDPKSGKQLVSRAQITELANARAMSPQGLADWIAKWTP
jgi:thiol-disulfide isomerase/thioredoxin